MSFKILNLKIKPKIIWNQALLSLVINTAEEAAERANPACNKKFSKLASTTPKPPGMNETIPRIFAV